MNKVKLQIARDMRKKLLASQDIPKIMAILLNQKKIKKEKLKN